MRTRTHVLLLAGLVVMSLTACQGRTGFSVGEPAPYSGDSGGTVSLSDRDLAPVDAYIGIGNRQWILGDDVEIVASREYFAQNLSVTRASGLVRRTDSTQGGETMVVLVYVGEPASASVMTNPRVLLGKGLTVTARRKLVVRLVRTTDANRPVFLRITARGEASRGRLEEVQQRAPDLVLGGQITRTAGGWTWTPFG